MEGVLGGIVVLVCSMYLSLCACRVCRYSVCLVSWVCALCVRVVCVCVASGVRRACLERASRGVARVSRVRRECVVLVFMVACGVCVCVRCVCASCRCVVCVCQVSDVSGVMCRGCV